MEKIDGFELIGSQKLTEIDGHVHVLKHNLSGARVLWLENDDENKSFSIAFKTPPTNSTGVFHILEHSVLCGSQKFPVKEPFVNLLKSSMQTFLNAMTFPDKTVYPVASTNEQDLMNLMNVYLDAVFNPLIYEKREIFEQEGWHKEVDDAGNVSFSGVVYNEMQGALSDPDSVLFDALCERLYPESAYSFESGGDPKNIPELSYEQFLETHAKHYVPSNAYVILYGNLDASKFLRVIDKDYLTPAHERFCAKNCCENEQFLFNVAKPVCPEVLVKEMDIDEGMTTEAIAFRLAHAGNLVDNQAVSILMDAVMGSNVAPLKARLLKTGIADDFYSSVIEPVEYPALTIACQGVKCDNALEILERETLAFFKEWSEGALDVALVEASINHTELVMREHNFGTADGVLWGLDALSTWLYDENLAYDALQFEQIFANLRQKLLKGEFEGIIRKYILDKTAGQGEIARAKVVQINKNLCEDEQILLNNEQKLLNNEQNLLKNEQKLSQTQQNSTISVEEKNKICENVARLQAVQSEPDSQENLAKLPYLKIGDISSSIKKHSFDVVENGASTALFHKNLSTAGLAYYSTHFDLNEIPEDDMFWLSLLSFMLGKFDTDDYTAEDINLKCRELLGKCRFGLFVPSNVKDERQRYFYVSTSCMEGKTAEASKLISSILHTTNFDNDERIKQILNMIRLDFQQSLVTSGHTFAKKRAESTLNWQAAMREEYGGIEFYKNVCELCEHADENLTKIKEKFNNFLTKFASAQVVHSTTTDADTFAKWEGGLELKPAKSSGEQLPASSWIPTFGNEAFAVKSDVTFTAVQSSLRLAEGQASKNTEFTGAWAIVSRALSFDYLWNTIRVQGGAYGCGFSMNQYGNGGFYTFRDPKAKQSRETIAQAGEWLKNFSPTEREFEGFVVSSVADFDKPCKPSALMARGDGQFFSGKTEEDREKLRDEVLHTKVDDVRALGQMVTDVAKNSSVCVVGNKQSLEDCGTFDEIIEL